MRRILEAIRIGQVVYGLLLGAAPYLLVYLVLKLLSGSSSGPGPGFATGLAVVVPYLMGAILIFALVCQGFTSFWLSRKGLRTASVSVWGVYIVYALFRFGSGAYVDVRTSIAAREDYSSRDLELPEGGLRHLLLVEQERGGRIQDRCRDICLSALKSGAAASIALPKKGDMGRLVTFRYARGRSCMEAESLRVSHWKNRQDYLRLERNLMFAERKLELMQEEAGSSKSKQQEAEAYRLRIESERLRTEQLAEILREQGSKPRLDRFATSDLQVSGHFDQCITFIENDVQAPEARINYGGAFQRPYGPCCGAAEIYIRRNGALVRLARWETGRGEDRYHAAFTLADVVSGVTGGQVAPDLEHYPVESIELELARLGDLAESGAYMRFPDSVRTWLKAVLWKELHRQRKAAEDYERMLELSQEGRRQLIRIASMGTPKQANSFLQAFGQLIDEATLGRLHEAVKP